ncbi:MAG: PqiC family protein [Candidatus Omnitrophica bacterium]|nr:PqiC family protein [Candidatus Omnitrophota bacterium]
MSLPEYCNRPQIVTRNNDDSLKFAQFDRWAEPLDKAMARTISHNLALLLPRINVETFPWNSIMPVKYQVIMNTLQLDCRLDKQVVLFMQWSILDAQSKKKLFDKHSDYRIPVGTHNYSDLVQAINVICESLSKEIAQALTEVVGKGPA